MAPRDFRAELRREDSLRREQGMPPAVRARLWSRLKDTREPKTPWHRRPQVWGLATAAVAVALVVFFMRTPAVRTLGGLEVARASADLTVREEAEGVEIQGGEASLVDTVRGITVENEGPLVVRREPSGVRLVRGRAEFSVNHREPGAAPAVVLVSGGAIEIMGTRFTVEEQGTQGTVTLHEGAVAFRRLGGEVVHMSVGQTLAWPVVESTEPVLREPVPPAPERPQPLAAPVLKASPPRASTPSAEEVLRELEVLRGRHEFEQAARYLEESMRRQPLATRERLSFELGSLLTHQLKDSQRACAHWVRHAQQFRRGHYTEAVRRARETLSCEGGR
ncbi:FecR domain-containing protein [Myxococcus stipitatus]|uniref:FecR domain-containing protein n=1 Tax=Myxococcus stipitatus TaxID=83455 RepID=UPI0030D1AA06